MISQCIIFIVFYVSVAVVVSGGGARNPTLLASLSQRCRCVALEQWERNLTGLTSANKEAVAFAVLGMATLLGVPSNVPSVTGASQPMVLGKVATRKSLQMLLQ